MKKFKRQKLIIPVIIILVSAAASGILLLFILKNNYPSKERIQNLALTAAKGYCYKEQRLAKTDCDSLSITETRGPVDYGPTDGRDEYTGNWFVTTQPDGKPDSFIYVVTNFAGDILYINTTGQNEYPYGDSTYK